MKILSRSMKSPPRKCWKHDGWQSLVLTMKVGECVELSGANERVSRQNLLRAGNSLDYKLTTRKTVKGTLEVYRLE